jgi:hypothetical protein
MVEPPIEGGTGRELVEDDPPPMAGGTGRRETADRFDTGGLL